ncbi:MAG: hypothetical protein AAF581_03080 [Planctomycetota bacterium]
MRRIACFLLIAFVVMSPEVVRAAPAKGAKLQVGKEVGQVYPDFVLPTVDGGTLRLSTLRGKKVLLFHFASW